MPGYANARAGILRSKAYADTNDEALENDTDGDEAGPVDVHYIDLGGMSASTAVLTLRDGGAAGRVRFQVRGANVQNVPINPPIRLGATPWVQMSGTGSPRVFYTRAGSA